MIALEKMMSFSLLSCAAALAGALTVTGCAAPGGDEPEPVGEAEAALGEKRQAKLGLVQLFADNLNNDLLGYGYIESMSGSKSLQRWLILSNPQGNTLQIRHYDPSHDPPQITAPVDDDLEGWEDLVGALWDPDGDTIYATCVSTVYAHAQTYNGQLWRPLPARPAPSYPTRDGGEWRAFAPDITLPPQSSPLVWPPTTTWIQANAVDDLMQLDPGDGKLFQVGSVRGDFFAVNGVDEELSAEYFYMKPAYAEAGHTDTATRIVDANSQAFLANWWSSIGSDWDVGDQMAINGCVNYKGDGLPSPL